MRFLFITGGRMSVVGGTSAGAPVFAGVAALINHYLGGQTLHTRQLLRDLQQL